VGNTSIVHSCSFLSAQYLAIVYVVQRLERERLYNPNCALKFDLIFKKKKEKEKEKKSGYNEFTRNSIEMSRLIRDATD
jgi:hypothetical protein